MGCCHSSIDREETVSRCKARKRYMKQFVQARHAFSASHVMYIRSLRSTGSALLQFANAETTVHNHHHHHHHYHNLHLQHHLPPEPEPEPIRPLPPQRTPVAMPPPLPLMSPGSDTWTSMTASPALPPPPPPVSSSAWDFWDPFVPQPPSSSRSVTEEEWEATTTTGSEIVVTTIGAASVTAPPSVLSGFSKETPSSDLAMVVSRNTKDLVEIIKELDDYFLKAAEAGGQVSILLEVPTSGFSNQNKESKVYNYGWSLNSSLWGWGSNQKPNGFGKFSQEMSVSNFVTKDVGNRSHCSTVERLYAWEKRLYQEVKNAETIKMELEKKALALRKLEMKRADYVKTEKTKKEVEKLESQMMVASQAIESTSAEIVKLRETELYPQLLELVKALTYMWRNMYECHQVQKHIVQQLEYLNTIPSKQPTSEIHRQATLQLELEVQKWHQSFCNLFKAHRDYIQSLTGWLRLSLFQFSRSPLSRTAEDSKIYSLCEEWHLALDRIPDKVASEGIKSLLTVIHAIVVQQSEEHKQKKKSDCAFKELEKKVVQLRSLECKYGPYSMPESVRNKDPVVEKRAKVETLKGKAEEEKNKHEKSVSVTRAMTLNNLQMGFPHVFQGIVGFSSVCTEVFESVYNKAKITQQQEHDVKRLLP